MTCSQFEKADAKISPLFSGDLSQVGFSTQEPVRGSERHPPLQVAGPGWAWKRGDNEVWFCANIETDRVQSDIRHTFVYVYACTYLIWRARWLLVIQPLWTRPRSRIHFIAIRSAESPRCIMYSCRVVHSMTLSVQFYCRPQERYIKFQNNL